MESALQMLKIPGVTYLNVTFNITFSAKLKYNLFFPGEVAVTGRVDHITDVRVEEGYPVPKVAWLAIAQKSM